MVVRAFANDHVISVGLLRDIGAKLVEVHGQFDNQRLMRPDSHRLLVHFLVSSMNLIVCGYLCGLA